VNLQERVGNDDRPGWKPEATLGADKNSRPP